MDIQKLKDSQKLQQLKSLQSKYLVLALLVAISAWAVYIRISPAMDGEMAGHLLSMDDPYYHYKQTNRLAQTGDIPDRDMSIYPPDGRQAPARMPYYYNAGMALVTGNPTRDILLLYPVFFAIFGVFFTYGLMKELTNNHLCGLIAALFLTTMPSILSKSVAGAVEEDFMGLVLGIMSMYLLIKALNSKSYKLGVIAGIAFTMTYLSWKGSVFLISLPFLALGLYYLITILFKQQVWHEAKITILACFIPLFTAFTVIKPLQIDNIQLITLGFLVMVAVLGEYIRVRFLKGEDNKSDFEKRLFRIGVPILIFLTIILFIIANSYILSIPIKTYEEFAGVAAHNYLVDKTIAEQSAFSKGDLYAKLQIGYKMYGAGETLTILCFVIVPLLLVLMLHFNKKENIFLYLRAYIFTLAFFVIAMAFVWVESRLIFSQSLGFILLGSMLGIFLPNKLKEIFSLKVISLAILIAVISPVLAYTPAQSYVDPSWFTAVRWINENTPEDTYVLTWWDYGHFITALSHATVMADPLQAGENYILQIARFFMGFDNEADAMAWLKAQPWNVDGKVEYIMLDYTMIGKATPVAFLAKNSYEVSNGEPMVNGACQIGIPCLNTPSSCCDESFDWRTISNKGGSARMVRQASQSVYDEYKLNTHNSICPQGFTTKIANANIKLGNDTVIVSGTYLYMGYGNVDYSDGKKYPAMILMETQDDKSIAFLIDERCQITNINAILADGRDDIVSLAYGVSLQGHSVPQIFVHIPEEWKGAMLTQLYLYDAKNLENIELVTEGLAGKAYPGVKIFRIKEN